MSKTFTPTDEKVLAGYVAWISLVRSLQHQNALDLSILENQLSAAYNRYLNIGETGAAEHIQSHLDDVRRMMTTALHRPSEG